MSLSDQHLASTPSYPTGGNLYSESLPTRLFPEIQESASVIASCWGKQLNE